MKILLNLTGTLENNTNLGENLEKIRETLKNEFGLVIEENSTTQEWKEFLKDLPDKQIPGLGKICEEWIKANLYSEHRDRYLYIEKFTDAVKGKTHPHVIATSLKDEFSNFKDICFIEKMLDEILDEISVW